MTVDGDTAEIAIGGLRHRLPSRGLRPGKATLAIRPSRVRIVPDAGLPATVEKVTYVGARMEYSFGGDFGLIFAVSDNIDAPYRAGTRVRIGLARIRSGAGSLMPNRRAMPVRSVGDRQA